jgi:Domain of unknown function (DUF397)
MNSKHEWRKSSHSGGGSGNCIEIAESPETVHVRDSKDKSGPTLAFGTGAWAAFIEFARQHTV